MTAFNYASVLTSDCGRRIWSWCTWPPWYLWRPSLGAIPRSGPPWRRSWRSISSSSTPYWTFAVSDTQYFITFAVMLTIALIISRLTARLREQSQFSRQRQQRAETLYHLSRELAATTGRQQLLTVAQGRLMDLFGPEVTILMPDASGKLLPMVGGDTSFASDAHELAVAQWVFEHGQLAGAGTDTLPDASGSLYSAGQSQRCRRRHRRSGRADRAVARPGPETTAHDLRRADRLSPGARLVVGTGPQDSRPGATGGSQTQS